MREKEMRERTHELASDPEITKHLDPKSVGKNPMAQRVVEAVEKSYNVTIEDAEALLQVIKENQMPVRFDSSFGPDKQGNQ